MFFSFNSIYLQNIIKPCWIVGQNSFGSKNSNKKEDSVLKDFQTGLFYLLSFHIFLLLLLGTYNVLISTDVVQAGLDIPQCSLVLRYDVN